MAEEIKNKQPRMSNNLEAFKNLQVGKKYKYADLCDVLEEPKLLSRQKEYQIARWERKCNLVKVENSPYYEVKEIYETEIHPIETRGRKNEYLKGIRDIIVLSCYQKRNTNQGNDESDYYHFEASKVNLYMLFGFFNQKFIEFCFNSENERNKRILENIKDKNAIMRQFESEVFGKCFDVLDSVRKRLKNEQLIDSHDTVEVYQLYRDEKTNRFYPIDTWYGMWRALTEEEQAYLMDIKKGIMKEMGCSTLSSLYYRGWGEKFRSKVTEIIYQERGWKLYRESVSFWMVKRNVIEEAEEILKKCGYDPDDEVVQERACEINEKMIGFLRNRTDINLYALNHGGATENLEQRDIDPSKGSFYKTLEILMELYELIDEPKERQDVKSQLLFQNLDNRMVIDEYKNIREMLVGELIKLPELSEPSNR